MLTFGPIFQLQFYGTICPCLQKSEDSNARQAVNTINTLCQRVQWIREQSNDNSNSSSSNASSSSGGFLGGIFAKAATVVSAAGIGSSRNAKNCIAQIIIRDSGGDGQPELFIDPIPEKQPTSSEGENNDDIEAAPVQPKQKQQSTGPKLNLKLRRVDKVSLDETSGQIILYAKSVMRDGKKIPAKELLRFVVLAGSTPITQDQRNLLVHHFMVLSEWERQRRAALRATEDAYESDEDDDDETNFITRHAQKATHFARRELEMQQTKRDREKRKSKLISEAGGLKYTAMAMANREI